MGGENDAAEGAAGPVVQLWCWRTDRPVADGERLLDPRERRRAADFSFARDRRRYVTAHAGMRLVLAGALGRSGAAGALCFRLGSHGKPFLVPEAGAAALQFSLSHTGDLAALAVAADIPVGVDIEMVRPVDPGLPARFFAAEEVAAIRAARGTGVAGSDPSWLAAFFAVWTAKEAVVKALGCGLSMSLDSFAVSPGVPPRLLRLAGVGPEGEGQATPGWTLLSLAGGVVAGTLAVPAAGAQLCRPPLPSGLAPWDVAAV